MARPANSSALRGGGATPHDDARLPSLLATPDESVAPTVPFVDLHSTAPLPAIDALPVVQPSSPGGSGLAFWLEGDALMCACPDCRAPMSVRLWLMIAECWRCGTIIELSQEQEREALRMMQQREAAMRRAVETGAAEKSNPASETRPRAHAPAAPTTQPPAPARDKQSPRPQTAPATPTRERTAPVPPPVSQRRPAPLAPPAPTTELTTIGTTGVWLREVFRDMPAWLLSLILHFVLLTIFGILTFGGQEEDRTIVISASLSNRVRAEGEELRFDLTNDPIFDLPVPDEFNNRDPQQREAMLKADQDARELRIDPAAMNAQLPDLARVKQAIKQGGTSASPLLARDPRVRVAMIKAEGGTTLTEAAVSRGLRWLALNQHGDGRWKLHSLPHASGGAGHIQSDTAATSLALLPFLGAGQSHLVGKYKDTVAPGLRWLIQQQKANGDLRGNSQGHSGMYAHGQCAIVLCEAYALTHDEVLKEPAQKAIDFIVDAQHAGGGWRYEPGQPGDTSVVGWQLMALQSARAGGLKVPDAAIENAGHYLDSVASHNDSRYAYQRGNQPTHVMTAEALLCRIYLGWRKSEPGLGEGVRWLLKNHMPNPDRPDIYYWYYATQTMHHYGGPEWDRWNLAMRDALVSGQDKSGKNAGSWPPRDPHANTGGRIYTTSLAVCSLEVYYRHLPVFRQLELESE